MSSTEPPRTAGRPAPSMMLRAALAVVSCALVGVLGYPSSTSSSVSTSPELLGLRPHDSPRPAHLDAPPGPELGVPKATTVFETDVPAVANLDPKLLRALHRAAADAAGDGIEFSVNSGWRSRNLQERLFREAVSTYGSKAEAARWVAIPGTSPHETGNAVDLGDSAATGWLSGHGAAYGLCQIYRNEPWHYELRPDTVDHGCPPPYADPTQDPRMQR